MSQNLDGTLESCTCNHCACSRDHTEVISLKIDTVDRKIMDILQHDALASYDKIAQVVHKSASAVRDRIGNLERHSVILGYGAIVDRQKLGQTAEAFVFCNLPLGKEKEAADYCSKIPSVIRVFHISGDRRTVLRVAARDNTALWELLKGPLTEAGVTDMDVKIILSTEKPFPAEIVDTE